ncbi:hypothetical protein THAOC_26232 [Thalassiosira oceanica]|uniref:Uncharacterized protein n=1 Tax=Thalassiosira oceanica TaxID=159749 RepID=K0RM84_THAOC|nr:hypothetical protein THAOC_26232 [Thalassiosira oceanica]|eukprot:EJK54200.1 hypothetical protein THAOC_26232 [Thalassiosira oceanica]
MEAVVIDKVYEPVISVENMETPSVGAPRKIKRWGEVNDETWQYCKMMADMELVKYKEDMESYNVYKERLEAIGEIPHDMKDRLAKKKRAADRKQGGRASSSVSPPSGPHPLPKPTRKPGVNYSAASCLATWVCQKKAASPPAEFMRDRDGHILALPPRPRLSTICRLGSHE